MSLIFLSSSDVKAIFRCSTKNRFGKKLKNKTLKIIFFSNLKFLKLYLGESLVLSVNPKVDVKSRGKAVTWGVGKKRFHDRGIMSVVTIFQMKSNYVLSTTAKVAKFLGSKSGLLSKYQPCGDARKDVVFLSVEVCLLLD